MTKAKLRQVFLARQKSLSSDERSEKNEIVVKLLFDNFDFANKNFINCFVTLQKNGELDTSPIFERFWFSFPQIIVCAPRINFETDTLENLRFAPETKLVANKWQILEPEGDEIINAKMLDVVLVPLVAFDESGFRAGYGKGFYDKFLKTCRVDSQKIGLSLFPPVKKIKDVADFDVQLDWCVTPEKVFKFKETTL